MKILAISAHHPPYHFGGYEIRVKNILDSLTERGHDIRILTNAPERQVNKQPESSPYPVLRELHVRGKARFFLREVLIDLQDTALLERQIINFHPDVIYIGHLYILSKAILPFLARKNIQIIYDEGGSGLIDAWTDHGRWFRFTGDYRSRIGLINWIKPAVIRFVCWLSEGRIIPRWQWPQKMRVIFNSTLNQNNALSKNVPIENSTIIHSGINTNIFAFRHRENLNTPLRIIVPGRIERRKSQKDAIELVKCLREIGICARVVLAGSGWIDGYFKEVERLIQNYGLSEEVKMLPMIATTKMVEEYQKSDICFFPSSFRTGFSRVPLEAMACGCIVISYGNEGSDEIIKNKQTGIIVEPQDFSEIIDNITKMYESPNLVKTMALNARKEIEENCSLEKYIEKIENIIINPTLY